MKLHSKPLSGVIVFGLFWLVVSVGHTRVDPQNGNFYQTWVDFNRDLEGYDLKMARTYNSRTLHKGFFGPGWCTDFESRLEPTPEGSLLYTECGAGEQILYKSPTHHIQDIRQVVSFIMKKEQDSEKNLFPSQTPRASRKNFLKELKTELLSDPIVRGAYALKWKYPFVPIKEKVMYRSDTSKLSFVQFQKTHYDRILPSGTQQRFNLDGLWTQVQNKDGNHLKLEYEKGRLHKITHSSGAFLILKYAFGGDSSSHVLSVESSDGKKLEYQYDATNENLIKAKNEIGEWYSYEYDTFHNLIKTQKEGDVSSILSLKYDSQMDSVLWYKQYLCSTEYKFQNSKGSKNTKGTSHKNENIYLTNIVKKCEGAPLFSSEQKYIYEVRADETEFLKKWISIHNDQTVSRIYNEDGYSLQSVDAKGSKTKYEYTDQGLLKQESQHKPNGIIRTSYEYLPNTKKVTKSHFEYLNRNGKRVGSIISKFVYDRRGNVVSAESTDGRKAKLTYDSKGRIVMLEDSNNKILQLKYDRTKSSLMEVVHTDVGKIVVREPSSQNNFSGKNIKKMEQMSFLQKLPLLQTFEDVVFQLKRSEEPKILKE